MARGYWTTWPWSWMRTMEAPRSRTSKKTRAMSTPMGNSQAWPWPQARAGSWAASRRAKNDRVKAAPATPRPSSRAVPSTVRRFDGSDDHIRRGTSRSRGQTGWEAGRADNRLAVGGRDLLAGLAPEVDQPAGRTSDAPDQRGAGPKHLGHGPDHGGLVVAGGGLGPGLAAGGVVGRRLVERCRGGGQQPGQDRDHRVLGQGPGQRPWPVAPVDREQDDHDGGQGHGEQAARRQAGSGGVVVEDLDDDGHKAADGQGRPQPAAQRPGRLEGEGAGVHEGGPAGEVGLGPAGAVSGPSRDEARTSSSFTSSSGWWSGAAGAAAEGEDGFAEMAAGGALGAGLGAAVQGDAAGHAGHGPGAVAHIDQPGGPSSHDQAPSKRASGVVG